MSPDTATAEPAPPRSASFHDITRCWLADEATLVVLLADIARLPPEQARAAETRAADWIRALRAQRSRESPMSAMLREYDLSSEEGVLLMCLAEALLRIPDEHTAEALIADKLGDADWEAHLGHSDSLFVNASTWGLMLTGKLVQLPARTRGNIGGALRRLVTRSGEPVVRLALRQAMRLMARQWVMGRSIGEALKRAGAERHSFDMLGEAALTADDAQAYFQSYSDAIAAIGRAAGNGDADVAARNGISVKLSALHPRYEVAQRDRVLAELVPRLAELADAARAHNIGLTVDAEEADRLELSLEVFSAVLQRSALDGWNGFGLALQAYSRRALPVIDWIAEQARAAGRRIPVRLVKGAYWDTEIKRAQELGLSGYPVFTRKLNTDVSYLACARHLLQARDAICPAFATHNAHTIAAVHAMAGDSDYEYQRLHGMGEVLYERAGKDLGVPCRVYAPVGSHEDLLPYLVRRLLENGANTSFVHRIHDEALDPDRLAADPVAAVDALDDPANPAIPLPPDLYLPQRKNSLGVNLADELELDALLPKLVPSPPAPLPEGEGNPVRNPADRRVVIGAWQTIAPEALDAALEVASKAQPAWDARPTDERAACLEAAADRLEERRIEFLRVLALEAGKTLPDGIAEVREAADFLRYYAAQARALMSNPTALPGPTGEHNELRLHGRGVFACISPWNFPLAIFTGQVAAALATGNAVIAKPAEQTVLVASRMVALLHGCGIPPEVLHCTPGDGATGAALVADARVSGVAFTGSVDTAHAIHRALAARDGPIPVLIAETGGQNAMIVDSSALPEQVVRDVVASAFQSAGQRCSAARVLYLQEDILPRIEPMLRGAMAELRVGDPALLSTDVGPVIDEDARQRLQAHIDAISRSGRLIAQTPLPAATGHGYFVAPTAVEIAGIHELEQEHFGPVLHVASFHAGQLDAVIDAINATGYGLTLGVHSRIEAVWQRVRARARVGNCYINRNQVGAVVGVQPFGGEGLSGTGPKAGGPHYLLRFVTERALTVNTAAIGGNAQLLSQSA